MILLCRLDELAIGTARGFDPWGTGEDTLFVVRTASEIVAYRNICPHQGVALNWRKDRFLDAGASHIVCAAHGAGFDIATGAGIYGACLGQALERIPHLVDADGFIRLLMPPPIPDQTPHRSE